MSGFRSLFPSKTGLRLLILMLFIMASPGHALAATLHIFAAASMTDAMNEAIETYTAQHTDVTIVPVYASSSTLARQIVSGAPSDLFVSANLRWMDWLEEQGIPLQKRASLLQNRLALIVPVNSEQKSVDWDRPESLAALLGTGDRLSVGDPDHVPAGLYARQALEALGQWETLEPRLARANDVRGALALVERGETPAGIVYQTDASASQGVRTLDLFPPDTHEAIVYPVALTDAEDNGEAAAFRAWLQTREALEIFATHGFSAADQSR